MVDRAPIVLAGDRTAGSHWVAYARSRLLSLIRRAKGRTRRAYFRPKIGVTVQLSANPNSIYIKAVTGESLFAQSVTAAGVLQMGSGEGVADTFTDVTGEEGLTPTGTFQMQFLGGEEVLLRDDTTFYYSANLGSSWETIPVPVGTENVIYIGRANLPRLLAVNTSGDFWINNANDWNFVNRPAPATPAFYNIVWLGGDYVEFVNEGATINRRQLHNQPSERYVSTDGGLSWSGDLSFPQPPHQTLRWISTQLGTSLWLFMEGTKFYTSSDGGLNMTESGDAVGLTVTASSTSTLHQSQLLPLSSSEAFFVGYNDSDGRLDIIAIGGTGATLTKWDDPTTRGITESLATNDLFGGPVLVERGSTSTATLGLLVGTSTLSPLNPSSILKLYTNVNNGEWEYVRDIDTELDRTTPNHVPEYPNFQRLQDDDGEDFIRSSLFARL